jgi:exoribonuclease II
VHLLYEEDGELKAGAVLERSPASFHVESPHGRRTKVKANNVLMEFERPAAGELLNDARTFAAALEIDFLWQCSGAGEFGFQDLAREYVGREPTPVEAAGVLMKLHAAPMYFYRRGKGRYQAAPEATLKLALAAVEKKKRVQEQVAAWAEELAQGRCPEPVAALKDELLKRPIAISRRPGLWNRRARSAGLPRPSFSSAAGCCRTATTIT